LRLAHRLVYGHAFAAAVHEYIVRHFCTPLVVVATYYTLWYNISNGPIE
jgi:hypothetical protein